MGSGSGEVGVARVKGSTGVGFREVGAIDHHLILGMASEWVGERWEKGLGRDCVR